MQPLQLMTHVPHAHLSTFKNQTHFQPVQAGVLEVPLLTWLCLESRRGACGAPASSELPQQTRAWCGRWGNQAHWMGEIQGQTIFTQLLVRLRQRR